MYIKFGFLRSQLVLQLKQFDFPSKILFSPFQSQPIVPLQVLKNNLKIFIYIYLFVFCFIWLYVYYEIYIFSY